MGVVSQDKCSSKLPDIEVLNSSFAANNNLPVDHELINNEIESITSSVIYPSFILQHVSPIDVHKHLSSIKTNAQGVDKINIKMISLCLPYCLNALTHIINFSISSNTFPNLWRKAFVMPIPKINSPTEPAHYRPISILPTLSKVLEKVVGEQVCNYLDGHHLWNENQSGYRRHHSTSTALLKIYSDIVDAIDNGELTLLMLLDYSKAFDMVNHNLLLAKLKSLGFMDHSIDWFQSYLGGRMQCISENNINSSWIKINNGVPQGSILGPLLFIILTTDISNAIRASSHHLYADDTQLYNHFALSNLNEAITSLNSDLESIKDWSLRNSLALNERKCMYIFIGSQHNLQQLQNLDIPSVHMGNNLISNVESCKNLGVIFDESLSWKSHINSLISKSYYKLKGLYQFKNFLSVPTKLKLCDSLILSNFNYCDILFGNINVSFQNKIQKMQNSCLRFCFSLKKHDHITSYLKLSNWLNMHNRRISHSLIMIYKIIHNLAPSYLAEIINRSHIEHRFQTRSHDFLPIPHYHRSIKQQSFFVKAISIYNQLPVHIKTSPSVSAFKHRIKFFLLNQQFSSD